MLGVPDLEAGELPKAFIVRKPGTEVDVDEINGFINGMKVVSLKEMDTLSEGATLSNCFSLPSEKGSTLKGKNLLLP